MERQELSEIIAADDKTPKFTFNGLTVAAKCVKVYDGDTCHVVFRFHDGLYRFTIRMHGYNSAEIHGETALEKSKAQESKMALEGKILNKVVTLALKDFDKYGRILAIVFVDGVNVNDWMISNGYGVEYNGRGEKKWNVC